MSIFTPKVSFIKKVSLIFQRKAFIIYTDNPIPSLLIPLAETDKIINKGIYKIFCDLSNNDVISFNSKQLQQKDLNILDRKHIARLNIDDKLVHPNISIDNVQNIQTTKQTMFLTANANDGTLKFMSSQQIKQQNASILSNQINSQSISEGTINKNIQNYDKKLQDDDKNIQNDDKKSDQHGIQKKQVKIGQEKAGKLNSNKIIPLALLTDYIASKPINIIHIQTSKQYLFLQFLKIFLLANILVIYRLITDGTRTQNHYKIKQSNQQK